MVLRSREEILATLNHDATYDDLPFQPEMLARCAQRLRVAKSAHKTCDNIQETGGAAACSMRCASRRGAVQRSHARRLPG